MPSSLSVGSLTVTKYTTPGEYEAAPTSWSSHLSGRVRYQRQVLPRSTRPGVAGFSIQTPHQKPWFTTDSLPVSHATLARNVFALSHLLTVDGGDNGCLIRLFQKLEEITHRVSP